MNFFSAASDSMQYMLDMEQHLTSLTSPQGIDKGLLTLVKLRASQINGCAYCIDMHTKEARQAGETEQRLYLLTTWRETNFYSDKEQAAFEYTEALTLISGHSVSDTLYQRMQKHFNDTELVNLSLIITTINSWNRLAISFKMEAGSYRTEK